ncbi:disease resistance protein RUN1-like [Pyrus x bretschneideri]|uniref:disease resistance protein RUN1-like n=1 Tax=Pyrus x bretschneideri TaxID=225117 RepID=UPI00203011DA|nr:disease resistance protein RUN1-like [Pyrus x bretschneideri]
MALVIGTQESSSSNSNSSTSRCSYDVFLSFRGEDTRKTFTDHLYTAFVNASFRTFRDDDELERGEDIKLEFVKAIQQSRSSVVVFSKDYASSRWCLNELVMILKRRKTSNHVVLPVFYDVDPSHLRKQTGCIAKAFARHQKTQSFDTVKGWREALAEAADLAGMVLQNEEDGHESKFIMKIVKVIEDKLRRRPISVDSNLVGIQSRVKDINLWLQDGSKDVGILVIHGMRGIGKTTIAKFVYGSNFERFERHSFVENIRDFSEKSNGLIQIQKQLLHDILNGRKVKIHSISEGMAKIEDAICSKRVLLVLDDVDCMEQLDGLLRMQDQFYPGSKIIITTSNAGLLNSYHHMVKFHSCQTLNNSESLELFSLHAFGQDHPTESYSDVSKSFVHHCGGLPLALKILGSSMAGKNIAVWESAISKLKVIPDSQILKKLKISYESLQDSHDQDLFLHIACFFIGMEKDIIVRILDACDFFTVVGIQNLIDRNLVRLDGDNMVQMHHMIRDMARGIVRLESKEPGERSRLWHHKDSFAVLAEKNGTETIQGLALNMQNHPEYSSTRNSNQVVFETGTFSMMHKLRLLQLTYIELNGSYEEFPTSLRWLCWHKFLKGSIPSDFSLKNLVVLEMCYSSMRQVWTGTKFLPSLKILNLSHSNDLTETPDFSLVPNLEWLILKDCSSLVDVHESIGNLQGLVHLNMEYCKSIKKLPENISKLTSLETLIISGCSSLSVFPTDMRKMESLKVFQADGVPIHQLLTATEEVTLWPRRSVEITWASYLPSNLVDLSLRNCNLGDNDFPREFGNLSALCSLNLGGNPIHSLPDCIRGVAGLRRLSFEYCKRLKSLVRLPTVGHLIIADCEKLETVTFKSLSEVYSRMRSIECRGNHKLVEFESVYKMEPIERVDIEMIYILGLSNLKYSTKSIMKYKIPARFHRWIEKRLPIQGLHEFGIFSTFLPGNYEVPQYDSFSHKSKGPSISFTVPVLPYCRIRGLNIFSVYEKSKSHESPNIRVKNMKGLCYTIMTEVRNKSKGLQWIYGPALFGMPSDDQDVIWLSHWKFGNKLEGGDELTVSVLTSSYMIYDEFQVKEFGVQVVYYEQVTVTAQENFTTDNPFYPRVIAGDLSHYLLPGSSGAYLLCHNPVLERRDVLSYVWFKHNSNEITGHGSLGLKIHLIEQEEDRESECTLVEHEESSSSNSNSIDSNGADRGWKVVLSIMTMATFFLRCFQLHKCLSLEDGNNGA